MYMHEPGEAAKDLEPMPLPLKAALLIPVLGTLVLGVYPTALLTFANASAKLAP